MPKVVRICFPDAGITDKDWNKSDYYLKLPNGSEIWIGGLDSKDRVEKILGNEYSTIYFNEASTIDYSSTQIAKTRLAEKNDLKNKTYYDCNPPKKSHWSYWLFEKKIDPLQDEPLKQPERYASMLMNPKDNLENIDEEYLELLENMPEKERNRFLLGLYGDDNDGGVYYAFNRDTHVVVDTGSLNGTLFIGMDFNINPMTAVISTIKDDVLYVHDEIWLENSDTYKMVDELKRRGYSGNIIPDSTGKARKTSGKSDHEILRESGFYVMPTHNPFVTDRVNNVNRLLTNNKIIINKKCKKLIVDLEKVVWKDNKLDQKTDPMRTHISDCLGYQCHKLMPLVSQPKTTTIQF